MAIKIDIDKTQTNADNFGMGDGHFENIIKGSFSGANVVDEEELLKNITAFYRYDFRLDDYAQKDLTRQANTLGKDAELELPHVYSHSVADRILDYRRKDAIAQRTKLSFSAIKNAELKRNQRIHVIVPTLGIDSDWQIVNISENNGVYKIDAKRYMASKYTYEASSSFPPDEIIPEPIPPQYGDTPPDPISSLVVTGSAVVSAESGQRVGQLDISWTPPNEGNYRDAEVSIKLSSEGASSYKSKGHYYNNTRITGITPNIAYDVQVVSKSPAGTPGLAVEATNKSTGSSTTAPTTPATPTATRSGRTWRFSITPNSAAQKISYYYWEIATSGGTLVDDVDKGGTEISYTATGTTSVSYKARAKAVNIYGQESSFSGYSTALSSELWTQPHLATDSVGNPQLQLGSVDHLIIGSLEVQTANINNLAATNAKLGNASVNELKRISVRYFTDSPGSFDISAGTKIYGYVYCQHNLGQVMLATVRLGSSHINNNKALHSIFISQNTVGIISVFWEIGNIGTTTITGVSPVIQIWYW